MSWYCMMRKSSEAVFSNSSTLRDICCCICSHPESCSWRSKSMQECESAGANKMVEHLRDIIAKSKKGDKYGKGSDANLWLFTMFLQRFEVWLSWRFSGIQTSDVRGKQFQGGLRKCTSLLGWIASFFCNPVKRWISLIPSSVILQLWKLSMYRKLRIGTRRRLCLHWSGQWNQHWRLRPNASSPWSSFAFFFEVYVLTWKLLHLTVCLTTLNSWQIDGSVATKQGIRFIFSDGSRIIFRLSVSYSMTSINLLENCLPALYLPYIFKYLN